MRTCIGCAEKSPQANLLRIVRAPNGRLRADAARRLGGRGGYLHRQPACWQQFTQRKGLVRSLGGAVDKAARLELVAQLQFGESV